MGIFVFFGSAIILYVKARQGPGPYFFASLFACICLGKLSHSFLCLNPMPNLLLQISHLPLLCFSHILSIWYTFFTHLIPTLVASFFFYQIGKAIILPLAFASALSLLGSILLFPSSISSQFTGRLQGVLTPLISAIDLHRTLLNTPFPIDSDPSFSSSMSMAEYTEKVSAAATSIRESEAALGSLAASARLLKSDLIYGRFSPLDFAAFQRMCRLMSGRTNGLATFFSLVGVGPGAGIGLGVNKSSGDTPAHTVPVSPIGTELFRQERHLCRLCLMTTKKNRIYLHLLLLYYRIQVLNPHHHFFTKGTCIVNVHILPYALRCFQFHILLMISRTGVMKPNMR